MISVPQLIFATKTSDATLHGLHGSFFFPQDGHVSLWDIRAPSHTSIAPGTQGIGTEKKTCDKIRQRMTQD